MVEDGQEFVVAHGGRGGRGNIRFATPRNPAPEIAENGEPGEERELQLELKILADVGLVELFQTGKIIIARNYQSFRMYAILAIIYLVIITCLTKLAKRLEKRLK